MPINKEQFFQDIAPYWDRLLHIAIHLLENRLEAEDAVQEAVLRAATKIHQFQEKSSLYTWVVRILTNHCYDVLRKRKREISRSLNNGANGSHTNEKEIDIADLSENVEKSYERNEESKRLNTILQNLKPDLRIVIVLKYYENLSVTEIAKMIQIPEGTVKSRLASARNTMREALEKMGYKGLE